MYITQAGTSLVQSHIHFVFTLDLIYTTITSHLFSFVSCCDMLKINTKYEQQNTCCACAL